MTNLSEIACSTLPSFISYGGLAQMLRGCSGHSQWVIMLDLYERMFVVVLTMVKGTCGFAPSKEKTQKWFLNEMWDVISLDITPTQADKMCVGKDNLWVQFKRLPWFSPPCSRKSGDFVLSLKGLYTFALHNYWIIMWKLTWCEVGDVPKKILINYLVWQNVKCMKAVIHFPH